MKNIMYLFIAVTLFSLHSLAEECNQNMDKKGFVAQAVEGFTFRESLSEEMGIGIKLLAQTYFDFSQGIRNDSKFCIREFYGFDHNKVLIGQDTFTRFNPLAFGEKSLGVDVSFLERSVIDNEDFVSAVKGALDLLNQRYGDGVSVNNATLEVNRSSLSESLSNTSFEICELGTTGQCYNQAMYRLFTFPLTEDPAGYLDKGIAIDFAQIIFDKGDIELSEELIRKAQETESYFEVLKEVSPDLVEEGGVLKP